MAIEDKLAGWSAPSSDTEQEKQDRTERMIREAVDEHPAFDACTLRVFAKGSYANNTNVRLDSDVDIAVECRDVEYWEESEFGAHPVGSPYEGEWTPAKLRSELGAALLRKFPNEVDQLGSTAFQIRSNTARVDADVVPCFSYGYYLPGGSVRHGTKIFKKDLRQIVNYPDQQLENATAKNKRTGYAFKKVVRVMKRVENELCGDGLIKELPSYFVECLVYNCPDSTFLLDSWTAVVRQVLIDLWDKLKGDEPVDEAQRMLEVNDCLFRAFVKAAWNYLEFK
jgi:hypothetical protein